MDPFALSIRPGSSVSKSALLLKVMVTEAAEMLGVTKEKVARLIKKGVLNAEPSTLDARRKLIPRVQVEAILARDGHPAAKRRKLATQDDGEAASERGQFC
jgi:excisionase family DNA binding protein